MKRDLSLRDLSSEHHAGLVLVRRIRQQIAQPEHAPSQLWEEVIKRFETELEAHFQKEENGLLPVLQSVGEHALVKRTLREHAAMRRMVKEGGPQDLAHFAQLLGEHIRFEEKELFEVAQRQLTDEQLEALAVLSVIGQINTPETRGKP